MQLLRQWLDATTPSLAEGWNQQERRGFADRAWSNAVIALAFIHHLAIARNFPFGAATDWIIDEAPVGVIEFLPNSDPTVRERPSRQKDILPYYTEETFMAHVSWRAPIVGKEHLPDVGRLILRYERS